MPQEVTTNAPKQLPQRGKLPTECLSSTSDFEMEDEARGCGWKRGGIEEESFEGKKLHRDECERAAFAKASQTTGI